MVARKELWKFLDDLLDAPSFQDGQENGLQIEGRENIERIAVAVSADAATVDAALEWGADALLTHHGILWQGQPLHLRGVQKERVAKFLRNDLNLLTYHLPLDAHPELGNNRALMDRLGVAWTGPGFPHKGRPIGGVGRVDAIDAVALVASFQEALHADLPEGGPFQHWNFGPKQVETIGIVTGDAPWDLQAAIDAELDLFLTGEGTEPIYHLAKEAGIHVVLAGHYATERDGIQRVASRVEKEFGVTTQWIETHSPL